MDFYFVISCSLHVSQRCEFFYFPIFLYRMSKIMQFFLKKFVIEEVPSSAKPVFATSLFPSKVPLASQPATKPVTKPSSVLQEIKSVVEAPPKISMPASTTATSTSQEKSKNAAVEAAKPAEKVFFLMTSATSNSCET